MKKIKIALVGLAVAMAGLFSGAAPVMAEDEDDSSATTSTPAACPEGTLQSGAAIGPTQRIKSIAQCNMPTDETNKNSNSLWNRVQTIINWVLAVLGIVAVVMVIIGGFTYLTSQGDPGKTKKGRDTILYGIIGLIIALLAFAIVNFVLVNVFA